MPPSDTSPTVAVCRKCGMRYSRLKGYFPISYSFLYKGVGYLPYCRDCIDSMFQTYVDACNDERIATRQMCRKLDLYWDDAAYDNIISRSNRRTVMTNYISKINTSKYAGRCYDDTLEKEGIMWSHWSLERPAVLDESKKEEAQVQDAVADEPEEDGYEIDEETKGFWGSGYTPKMYSELEQRRSYWMSRLPDGAGDDIGTEALLRQACILEISINHDRAAGKPIDKSVNALNTILGSMNMKPAQKKEDVDAQYEKNPLGVWLYKYEYERPLPEIDDDMKDVNRIKKYVSTWVRGHLAKMVGIKNSYSKMYEDEVAKYRVDRPEYDDEDDETLLQDMFDDGSGDLTDE